jgi:hypothetical protein
MAVINDLQVTVVPAFNRVISLNLSFMFFVQAKAVTTAGNCTEADRLRQFILNSRGTC